MQSPEAPELQNWNQTQDDTFHNASLLKCLAITSY
jgi:hypothetical protein